MWCKFMILIIPYSQSYSPTALSSSTVLRQYCTVLYSRSHSPLNSMQIAVGSTVEDGSKHGPQHMPQIHVTICTHCTGYNPPWWLWYDWCDCPGADADRPSLCLLRSGSDAVLVRRRVEIGLKNWLEWAFFSATLYIFYFVHIATSSSKYLRLKRFMYQSSRKSLFHSLLYLPLPITLVQQRRSPWPGKSTAKMTGEKMP